MKLTFLIPPCYDNKQPAERSAGCTRIVYPMINIYELTAAATLREAGHEVDYRDFVSDGQEPEAFDRFLSRDLSDAYLIWSVNLSLDSDLKAVEHIRMFHRDTPVILMGPAPTYYMHRALYDSHTYLVRGEPELTLPSLPCPRPSERAAVS